ncbi:hypothetical protein HKCCSP123_18470 [Rhodobacterales bacterium HKCCSP123]|nr:hypothetical protein [Rhodobacterales bacterium HKCCSP123]
MRRIAVVLALALAPPAAAQPEGFSGAMDALLAPGGEAAPMLRCAGLFRAFRLLVGEDTEIGAEALEGEVDLAVAAGLLRETETGAEAATALEEIAPLIAAAAELYLDRMVGNEAAAGNVMDPGLDETLAACAELRGAIGG